MMNFWKNLVFNWESAMSNREISFWSEYTSLVVVLFMCAGAILILVQ